jgi:hypothetical protein
MFTLRLNHLDIRAAALAIAETSRRRPRGEERSEAAASRNLARVLAEAYPVALATGEVVLDVTEEAAFLLGTSLNRAAKGPRWYGSRATLPVASFRAVAARLEA